MVALGERCFGAWGQLKRGFVMVALGEMCSHGMGAVETGVSRW